MVALLFSIMVPMVLAVGLMTLVVGTWRHIAGSGFEAELHRQLAAEGPRWIAVTSLVVVRLRSVAGSSHR